jgi:hypothetical protein
VVCTCNKSLIYLQVPTLNGNQPTTENIPVLWANFVDRFYSIMFLDPVHAGPSVDADIGHYNLLIFCRISSSGV